VRLKLARLRLSVIERVAGRAVVIDRLRLQSQLQVMIRILHAANHGLEPMAGLQHSHDNAFKGLVVKHGYNDCHPCIAFTIRKDVAEDMRRTLSCRTDRCSNGRHITEVIAVVFTVGLPDAPPIRKTCVEPLYRKKPGHVGQVSRGVRFPVCLQWLSVCQRAAGQAVECQQAVLSVLAY